jgi:glycosyltransferase involved in cell wall biosynthesis
MMAAKRALFFFPLNPAEQNSGSQNRVLNLLLYFKRRNVEVDFASKLVWGKWTEASEKLFDESKLAKRLFIFRRKPEKKNALSYFFNYKIQHLAFEKKLALVKGSFPNHTTLNLRRQLDAVLKENTYDYIIISYAYWADLIKKNPYLGKATTIIDTHDLLSSQHQDDAGFDRAAAIGDEMRRLSLFDQIWAISPEETYLFGQFFKDKVKYIPMMMDEVKKQANANRDFDLIYVATDNPHNLISAAWFFKEVYPLLPSSLSICIIGTIVEHIPATLTNIHRVEFTTSLTDYYSSAKVVICPMLSGTGVKVKVVEAIAHGLPVVCTEHGIDGVPDKTNNGCLVTNDAEVFAANIMHLLQDDALYTQQSELALACFKRNFNTQTVYKKLDAALNLNINEEG